MRKSLKRRILTVVLIGMVFMNVVSILMNFLNYISTQERFGNSTASTVAETCSLILDNDALVGYINTGCRDSDYYVMWNKLIDYRNTNPDIVELSVVWFEDDGCHYIFDTDITENGAFLGDSKEFDMRQSAVKRKLIRGEEVDSIVYGQKIDVYRLIRSSFNIPLGYVVVGISTEQAERELHRYLLKLFLVMFFLAFLIFAYMFHTLSKNVIRPINQLASAAAGYADSVSGDEVVSPLSRLSIKTGDEIERLLLSVQKMENDLLSSTNNLSIAMWNSHHDSMTQLYNKRYLHEFMENHAELKSFAAIYFDVDNLKKMNDICGHEAGDEVIKKTADFIQKYERQAVPIYHYDAVNASSQGKYEPKEAFSVRMGGDEFLMLVLNMEKNEIADLVEKMKSDPATALTEKEMEVQCRIAIGYAFDSTGRDLELVIQDADKEMYKDKKSHR